MTRWWRPRLSVRELTGLVAIVALGLALVVQGLAVERRARALRGTTFDPRWVERTFERQKAFLGPVGRSLLEGASRAESLALTTRPGEGFGDEDIRPTGRAVPPWAVRALAESLLDPQNYIHGGLGDDSDPEGGLRIRSGSNSLDVLWFHKRSWGTGHQDLWVRVRDASGRVIYGQGYACFSSARLQFTLESLAAPTSTTP